MTPVSEYGEAVDHAQSLQADLDVSQALAQLLRHGLVVGMVPAEMH